MHISQKIIAMTIVVIGTSLPELTITVLSAKKGEFDMAIGNIVGTNIFNICVVLGLPITLFGSVSSPAFNLVDLVVVLLAALLLFLFGRTDKELSRREGIIMVITVIVYYAYIFIYYKVFVVQIYEKKRKNALKKFASQEKTLSLHKNYKQPI